MNKKSKKEQLFILLAILTICITLFATVGCSLSECVECAGTVGCQVEHDGGTSKCTDCTGCLLGCEVNRSSCQVFSCSKCFVYECNTGGNDITCGSNCAGCPICGGIKD